MSSKEGTYHNLQLFVGVNFLFLFTNCILFKCLVQLVVNLKEHTLFWNILQVLCSNGELAAQKGGKEQGKDH